MSIHKSVTISGETDVVAPKTPAQVIAGFIHQIWEQIGGDIAFALEQEGESTCLPAEHVVELCVDADRMTTMLHRESDRAAAEKAMAAYRDSKMGWDVFCKAIAKELPFKKYWA